MPSPLRRTKIICTLGPSTDKEDVLKRVVESGLDVARINTAHGTPEEHGRRIDRVREIAATLQRPVGVLIDLPGPKLRLGDLPQRSMELRRGSMLTLGAGPKAPADAIPV